MTPVVGLAFFIGCFGGDADRAGVEITVRDSAGIRIVENGPIPPDARPWVLRGPVLEIGSFEGDPDYELFRVSGGQRLGDGRIVIANGGTHELRFYTAEGRHIRTVGGEGEGPGEFGGIAFLRAFAGDSLLVYDFRQRRASVFDDSGEFVRSFTVATEGGSPQPRAAFADGALIVLESSSFGPDAEGGVSRRDTELHLVDARGSVLASLGVYPGFEAYVHRRDDFMIMTSRWFGRGPFATVAGERAIVATNDAFELHEYGRSGRLTAIVRVAHAPVTIGPEHFEELERERLANITNEDQRRQMAEIYERMPRHQTLPAFGGLAGDPLGNVWVRDYLLPDDDQRIWTVLDSAGRALGKVEMPSGLRVLELGADYVLGATRDELDVERVQLWDLEKVPALESG